MPPSLPVVFVELHKTGSSRVRKLLAEVAGTEAVAKHPDTADALADLGQPVVGYVCDPLIWYLAVWKLGCTGKGDLYKRLVDPARWGAMMARRSARVPEPGKDGKDKAGGEIPEHWGAERARSVWYGDAENPEAFREWLQAVLDTRGLRRLVSNAYQTSGIQKFAGLMTFEYLTTFVRGASDTFEKWVDSHGALLALNEKKAITQHFVRAENPGTDLLRVLGDLGLAVNDEQAATARAWDLGAARHNWHIDTFYDPESRQLVMRRDKVIFKLFGYAGLTTEAILPALEIPAAVAATPAAAGAADRSGEPAGEEPQARRAKGRKAGGQAKAGSAGGADGTAKANKQNKGGKAGKTKLAAGPEGGVVGDGGGLGEAKPGKKPHLNKANPNKPNSNKANANKARSEQAGANRSEARKPGANRPAGGQAEGSESTNPQAQADRAEAKAKAKARKQAARQQAEAAGTGPGNGQGTGTLLAAGAEQPGSPVAAAAANPEGRSPQEQKAAQAAKKAANAAKKAGQVAKQAAQVERNAARQAAAQGSEQNAEPGNKQGGPAKKAPKKTLDKAAVRAAFAAEAAAQAQAEAQLNGAAGEAPPPEPEVKG